MNELLISLTSTAELSSDERSTVDRVGRESDHRQFGLEELRMLEPSLESASRLCNLADDFLSKGIANVLDSRDLVVDVQHFEARPGKTWGPNICGRTTIICAVI